ncbi:MAG: hypothetical protein HYZ83_05335 [Candidatus Omnitrophica bacterium]|nr:hypothetical protein [Candidatus Omnitrophota bacterium]
MRGKILLLGLALFLVCPAAYAARKIPYQKKTSPYFVKSSPYVHRINDDNLLEKFGKSLLAGLNGLKNIVNALG